MIRINLLPEEFRRSERTSFKLLAATLAAVIVVCSAFGWFGLVYFGDLGQLEEERHTFEDTLRTKRERATYHDALEVEKKDYEARSETIQNICRSRIAWTEVLDQLIDVVNNDGNTERHMAWFRSMSVRDSGDQKTGPLIGMPGYVQGGHPKKIADFHDDLEHAPFFADVLRKSPPSGSLEIDTKRSPSEALFFGLEWTFKSQKDWQKNKKPAKPVGK